MHSGRYISARAQAIVAFVALGGACADAHERSGARVREDQADHEQPEAQPDPGVCEEVGRVPIKLEKLETPERFDFIAIRRVVFFPRFPGSAATDDSEAWTETKFETLAELGVACATASSAACGEKVVLHPASRSITSCSQLCLEWSLVTTRGDEVKRWTGPDEVLALLGEIDNVDEALARVASQGYSLYCPSDDPLESESDYPVQEGRTEAREVEDGFEVIATRDTGTCPFILRRVTLHVSPTGTVTELGHEDFLTSVCA